jgi:hypothetical protein
MRYIQRFLEMIFYGILIEIVVAFVLIYFFSLQEVNDHLVSVFNHNNGYLSDSLISSWIEPVMRWVVMPVIHWLRPNPDLLNYLGIAGLSTGVFLQKVVIAIISIPVFALFILIGIYDGIIQRELRRYRVAIESTRRERFDGWAKHVERFAFVGYVSIPVYIPAPLWFMFWGVITAILLQITTSFIQKYI